MSRGIKGKIFRSKGGDWIEKKKERQEREINIDGFGKDHKDLVFCSSSFNLLHDLNSSICNE